jgi:hypothetical protein
VAVEVVDRHDQILNSSATTKLANSSCTCNCFID